MILQTRKSVRLFQIRIIGLGGNIIEISQEILLLNSEENGSAQLIYWTVHWVSKTDIIIAIQVN